MFYQESENAFHKRRKELRGALTVCVFRGTDFMGEARYRDGGQERRVLFFDELWTEIGNRGVTKWVITVPTGKAWGGKKERKGGVLFKS